MEPEEGESGDKEDKEDSEDKEDKEGSGEEKGENDEDLESNTKSIDKKWAWKNLTLVHERYTHYVVILSIIMIDIIQLLNMAKQKGVDPHFYRLIW